MTDKQYFSHLYEIASHLNKEFSLPAALRQSLEKTVELLGLQTGWIWLTQKDNQSVYLAASYNLPPALSKHPERLSGWCYCIEKYFSGGIEEATNISEITCSRLKDLSSGTQDLLFHATIPIITNGEKVGLINLLSKQRQQLEEKQLSILNTISELIGMAIQRTRLQDAFVEKSQGADTAVRDLLKRVLEPRLAELARGLNESVSYAQQKDHPRTLGSIKASLQRAQELKKQFFMVLNESLEKTDHQVENKGFHYPASPLTRRELEVLGLVKKGLTNAQIAEQLFIAERTVKFHITSILSKLYAGTRTQAVDIALQRGLLNA